jgi:hypothetical protein
MCALDPALVVAFPEWKFPMNEGSDRGEDQMPAREAERTVRDGACPPRHNSSFDRPSSKLKFIAYYESELNHVSEQIAGRGQGFADLAALTGAVPQFSDHYQPRLPATIELYGLQNEHTLEQQIAWAKGYGISGFCIRYNWVDSHAGPQWPLNVLDRRRDLDFPFCLSCEGANSPNPGSAAEQQLQTHHTHSLEYEERFIADILRYLDDPRYMTIDDRPLLIASRLALPRSTAERWRQTAHSRRGTDLFLVYGVTSEMTHRGDICGFDAAVQDVSGCLNLLDVSDRHQPDRSEFCGTIYEYTRLQERACEELKAQQFTIIPCVAPGWDDTPTRGSYATCLIDSTPARYQSWLAEAAFEAAPISGSSYVFIDSWNGWAKGSYLEPDQKYGHAFLRATADALLPYSPAPSGAIASKSKLTPITSLLPLDFTPKSRTAIVIHAFYPDVLDDLLERLQPCDAQDIFISVAKECAGQLIAVIARHVRNPRIYVVPNRGRDVRPFLFVLKILNQLGYDSFVKLHTKKSVHTAVGSHWHDALVAPLVELCKPHRLKKILDDHPEVSLFGSTEMILDGSTYMGSSGNMAWLQRLCGELNINPVPSAFNFVAGTMFAGRLAAFQPLIEDDLIEMIFEEELGQRDGTLAHALERFFGLLITWRGETIAKVAMAGDELVVDAANLSFPAVPLFDKRPRDWSFHSRRPVKLAACADQVVPLRI